MVVAEEGRAGRMLSKQRTSTNYGTVSSKHVHEERSAKGATLVGKVRW